VNGALVDAFRHNCWATKELLGFCRGLSEERLTSPATGTFGGIRDTFNHLVLADGDYFRALAGNAPPWVTDQDDGAQLEQLETRVGEMDQFWEAFLSEPIDADRAIILDQGTYEARAGVIVAQALHHANAHREQISAILTGFGMEPPDIQAWAYGEATGRGWERTADREPTL
jgi:uncharacterized damage-inducible protein DinB